MVSGRPSRDGSVNTENVAFPIGPAGEPLKMSPGERPTRLQRGGISSVVRLWVAVVELRARVRGGQLRSLVDLGSTGNYISDRCLAALNIPVVPEDEHGDLTLADGSVICVPRVPGLRAIHRVKTRLGVRYPRDCCTRCRPTGTLPSVAAAPLTLTYCDYLPCRLDG